MGAVIPPNQKIFGIGFSKTGTTSLEYALECLGYKVCKGHWNNNYSNFLVALYVNSDYEELFKIIDIFDAFADAPWGGTELYKEIHGKFPNSKFILTVRDPERWYKSFINLVTLLDKNLETAFDSLRKGLMLGTPYFFQHVFEIKNLVGKKDKIIHCFTRHNEKAIAYLTEVKADFIVLNWENGDGWNELCSFLNKEVPPIEFPHINKSVDHKNFHI